jgi:hypothetical protein
MIDSSMIVNNLTLLDNGENGLSVPFNDRAGLFGGHRIGELPALQL